MSQRTHCSIYAACITPYSSGTCFTKTDIKSFTSSAVADSPQCGLRVTDEMGRTSPSRSLARLRMLPRNTRSTKSSNKICRVALGLSYPRTTSRCPGWTAPKPSASITSWLSLCTVRAFSLSCTQIINPYLSACLPQNRSCKLLLASTALDFSQG